MKKLLVIVLALVLSISCVFAVGCNNKVKIGVQSGTTGQYFVDGDEDWGFDGIEGYEAKGYSNGGLAVADLKNKAVKYVVIDRDPALRLKASITGINVIDIPLTVEEYAFGVDKAQPELLSQINAILASTEGQAKLQEIFTAYATGEGITPFDSADFDASKADTQLVVATNANFAPFEYKDGNKFAGIDMEIAKYIADTLDMELVIQDMEFDSVVTSVGSNGVDVAMAGLTVNDTRKQSVDFTTSYYNAAQVLITLDSDKSFDDCETAEDVLAVLAANLKK